jgi:hypothetical protein
MILLIKVDELDKKAESSMLNEMDLNLKHVLNERLAELLREEELKWYQRAKVKHLLEGDANMKYYHLLANDRHRKTRIFQLEDGNDIISGNAPLKNILPIIIRHYLDNRRTLQLFLDESHTEDIPQVWTLENEFLIADFTEDEARIAIFQMEHNKAPRPYGFPLEFYQVF